MQMAIKPVKKDCTIRKSRDFCRATGASNGLEKKDSYRIPKQRFRFVRETTQKLADMLGLREFYPEYFNVADNIILKIGGYNCCLGARLLHIETKTLKSAFCQIPFISKIPFLRNYGLRKEYEIVFDHSRRKHINKHTRYSSVFFASLNNYLNPFFSRITSMTAEGKPVLMILPACSRGWKNYDKLTAIPGLDVVFLEDLFGHTFDEEVSAISQELSGRCEKHKSKIIASYRYQGVNSGKSFYPVIKGFVTYFVSRQAVVTKYLDAFLRVTALPETEFYIARNRRSLENSFVQIANMINGNTSMLLHGMIFANLECHLFSYNFGAVKRVHVWGLQGKDVVDFRQKHLGEKQPEIIIDQNMFFASLQKKRGGPINKVLFALQMPVYKHIAELAKSVPKDINAIIRLQPNHKDMSKKFAKRIRRRNVCFDNLERTIEEHFSDTSIFVSYTSTTILEAIYNNIPTLILGFPDLLESFPCVFLDSSLDETERSLIFAGDIDELISKTALVLHDANFRQKVLAINRKLMSYFVSDPMQP